jgi:hypothetical protein
VPENLGHEVAIRREALQQHHGGGMPELVRRNPQPGRTQKALRLARELRSRPRVLVRRCSQEARFWNRIEPDQRAFHDRLLADLVNQARLGRISQADVRRMIKERFGSDPTIPPMEVFREQIQQQLPTDPIGPRELKRMNWPRNRAFD